MREAIAAAFPGGEVESILAQLTQGRGRWLAADSSSDPPSMFDHHQLLASTARLGGRGSVGRPGSTAGCRRSGRHTARPRSAVPRSRRWPTRTRLGASGPTHTSTRSAMVAGSSNTPPQRGISPRSPRAFARASRRSSPRKPGGWGRGWEGRGRALGASPCRSQCLLGSKRVCNAWKLVNRVGPWPRCSECGSCVIGSGSALLPPRFSGDLGVSRREYL